MRNMVRVSLGHCRFLAAKCMCHTGICMVSLTKGLVGLTNQWLSLRRKSFRKTLFTRVNWTRWIWRQPLSTQGDNTPKHPDPNNYNYYNSINSWGIKMRLCSNKQNGTFLGENHTPLQFLQIRKSLILKFGQRY